jgi:hypothetical protein
MADCPICHTDGHKLSCPHGEGGQLAFSARRNKPEALRLADALDRDGYACFTDDMRAAASELRRLHAALARWKSMLDPVMPADFKDWHQNHPDELPAVAAWVISNLRDEQRRLHAEVERLNAKAIDTHLAVRKAIEMERTRCAALAATMTHRKRWIEAATHSSPDNMPPCEIAAAILKGPEHG